MNIPRALRALIPAFTLSALLVAASPQSGNAPVRVRVGGALQESKLIHRVPPVYPPLAREARIQGTVRLQVIIAEDGTVKEMQILMGHPLLAQSALDAVRQWRYRDTLLNGRPVEVVTTVDVVFTLGPSVAEDSPSAPSAPAGSSAASTDATPAAPLEDLWQQARLNPNDAEAHYKLAIALRTRNDADAAVAAAQEAVRLKPDHLQARLLLANTLLNRKRDIERAILEYREAIRIHPGAPEPCRELGLALQRRGDWLGAIDQYREVVRLQPENLRDYIALGRALYVKWGPEVATAEFRRAASNHPDSGRLHKAFADALKESGSLAAAIAQYREALGHVADDDAARAALEELLKEKAENDRQIESLRARLQKEPDDFNARRQLGFLLLQTNGDADAAITEFREMIRIQPQNAGGYRLLALHLVRRDGTESAIAEFRDRARRDPENAAVRTALAMLLELWGDLDAALAEARRAVELQPESADAHQQLGAILGSKGDEEASRAALARAAELRGMKPSPSSSSPVEANEASAIGSLRTLNTALVTYAVNYGGFPANLAQLGPGWPVSRDAADLIDIALASGIRNGYWFTYIAVAPDDKGAIRAFILHADPMQPGTTGNKFFFSDQSGIIRVNEKARATASSPPLR